MDAQEDRASSRKIEPATTAQKLWWLVGNAERCGLDGAKVGSAELRLDHVFVNEEATQVTAKEVVWWAGAAGEWPVSDHAGVCVELQPRAGVLA